MLTRRQFTFSIAALQVAAASRAFAADRLDIAATPVPLDENEPARRQVGSLVYRGGLILNAPDRRFGGWSDLVVDPNGGWLIAVSDRGVWMETALRYRADGHLIGLAQARMGPLIDTAGREVYGDLADAEGLAILPDGSMLVSFERWHRLWLYPAAEPPFSLPPRRLRTPREMRGAPSNGGLEAILRLSSGQLVMFAEELMEGDDHVGWIGDGNNWEKLLYRAAPDFKPVGMAEFPPGTDAAGDVLVLERKFSFTGGLASRIVRVKRSTFRAGARLSGQELALLQQPVTVDNFEGIAIARGERGSARIYILSDDNHFFLQRNLLLMFELPVGAS